MKKNIPKFPLYIPTKGRSEYMITAKCLTEMGVPHYLVVEPFEVNKYQDAIYKMNLISTIIPLDIKFKNNYELCDNYGLSQSTGAGPARNCAWEHSIKNGHKWHWVMDDNIKSFRRLNKNEKVKVSDGAIFCAMEDFVLRYTNVGMAGPNYHRFAPARVKQPPFITNTRIYSCNLIRNNLKFRWRGRHNEDTILSLDILRGGFCTIQFNAFLQEKMDTQKLKGGNTTEFYHRDSMPSKGQKYSSTGTLDKTKLLISVYPDIAKMVYRYKRIHHHVDYSEFKKMKLIKKNNLEIENGINNYGMELRIKKD